jgi:hypothetical protein
MHNAEYYTTPPYTNTALSQCCLVQQVMPKSHTPISVAVIHCLTITKFKPFVFSVSGYSSYWDVVLRATYTATGRTPSVYLAVLR